MKIKKYLLLFIVLILFGCTVNKSNLTNVFDDNRNNLTLFINTQSISDAPYKQEFSLIITEDDLVEEVNDSIALIGTTINSITKLPKGCKNLFLNYGHSLGGGSSTYVKGKIHNITIDNLFQGSSHKGSGLTCNLKNIKNITVKNTMYISDEMLGYYSLAKGKKYFEQVPSDMLTDFFKDNNVKPENCKFVPGVLKTRYDVYDIKLDEKKGLWYITNGGDKKLKR